MNNNISGKSPAAPPSTIAAGTPPSACAQGSLRRRLRIPGSRSTLLDEEVVEGEAKKRQAGADEPVGEGETGVKELRAQELEEAVDEQKVATAVGSQTAGVEDRTMLLPVSLRLTSSYYKSSQHPQHLPHQQHTHHRSSSYPLQKLPKSQHHQIHDYHDYQHHYRHSHRQPQPILAVIRSHLPLACILLLLIASVTLTIPAACHRIAREYAYAQINIHRSFLPRPNDLPTDDRFWRGVRDLANTRHDLPSSSSSDTYSRLTHVHGSDAAAAAADSEVCHAAQLPRHGVQSAPGFTSCADLADLREAVCAFREVAGLNGGLKGLPRPALGAEEFFTNPAPFGERACATRDSRFARYGTAGDIAEQSRINFTSSIPWSRLDLGRIQRTCVERNHARSGPPSILDGASALLQPHRFHSEPVHLAPRQKRTAIVLRAWDGLRWTQDDLLNIRAMITELALFSGGEFEVYVLMHVRNATLAAPLPGETLRDVKLRFVPEELESLTELWTYPDCERMYPKVGEFDVYYHTFMPMQLFALRHQEFDFYWNWEMDVRYTGHYYTLLSRLAQWSLRQSEEHLWERNARFYIPSYHGSYSDFEASFESDARATSSWPSPAAGNTTWAYSRAAPTRSPYDSTADEDDGHDDLLDQEADLITLFPIFDPEHTMWPYKDYLVNYAPHDPSTHKPRRATVNTDMRLSRRLLAAMHRENRDHGRSMMSEMWPPTVALHYGLKAVYAPHPVYLDRRWDPASLHSTFNAGPAGQVGGGLTSVINQGHLFAGATWYWNSEFPLRLYQRWLGNSNSSGPERNNASSSALPGVSVDSHLRGDDVDPLDSPGSSPWEEIHGQICLPPMLLHPIKSEVVRK